jgi:hypothetical protein
VQLHAKSSVAGITRSGTTKQDHVAPNENTMAKTEERVNICVRFSKWHDIHGMNDPTQSSQSVFSWSFACVTEVRSCTALK